MGLRSRLFWASAAVVGYTYVGFPLVVLVRGRLRPTPYRSAGHHSDRQSARGSPQRGPRDRPQARECPRPRLPRRPPRHRRRLGRVERRHRGDRRDVRWARHQAPAAPGAGRPSTERRGCEHRPARSWCSPTRTACTPLTRSGGGGPFADPSVGGVAGNQRYRPGSASDATTAGEQVYWDFDRLLKEAESRAGSTISATGAIYAIRRSLFRGVPVGVTDDFAVSTSVIEQGYRLVFAADALAWEPVASSGSMEWDRKVRIMTRGLRGVFERRALLNPTRYGFYSVPAGLAQGAASDGRDPADCAGTPVPQPFGGGARLSAGHRVAIGLLSSRHRGTRPGTARNREAPIARCPELLHHGERSRHDRAMEHRPRAEDRPLGSGSCPGIPRGSPIGARADVSARRLPNLLIVGIPKSGTTSLFAYLAQHRDICGCTVKEPGYFDQFSPRRPANKVPMTSSSTRNCSAHVEQSNTRWRPRRRTASGANR